MVTKYIVLTVMLLFCLDAFAFDDVLPRYELKVRFNVENNTMAGKAVIRLQPGTTREIYFPPGISVNGIIMNGTPVMPVPARLQVHGTIEVSYGAVFDPAAVDPDNTTIEAGPDNAISAGGILLTEAWYPEIHQRMIYSVTAVVPGTFTALSEADALKVQPTGGATVYIFSSPVPRDRISLAAAPFICYREAYEGCEIEICLLAGSQSLVHDLLEHVKERLSAFSLLLGPFPYHRFTIVQNMFSIDASAPTMVQLALPENIFNDDVRWQLSKALAGQWFGDTGCVDSDQGGWAEGLVNYLSYYSEAERQGKGALYRKNLMLDYQGYAQVKHSVPLQEYKKPKTPAIRDIDIDKFQMVFHMLKKLLGEDLFYDALRRLAEDCKIQELSWDGLRKIFERQANADLGWFFEQWTAKKSIPVLTVDGQRSFYRQGMNRLAFNINQKGPPFRLRVPVTIVTPSGETWLTLTVDKKRNPFEIAVDGPPRELIIDAHYDVMRSLAVDETPPVLSLLFAEHHRTVVVPDNESTLYAGMIQALTAQGFQQKRESQMRDSDIRIASLVVFEQNSLILQRLFGIRFQGEAQTGAHDQIYDNNNEQGNMPGSKGSNIQLTGVSVRVRKNPLNLEKVIAIITGTNKKAVNTIAPTLFRYGHYSRIFSADGRQVTAETNDVLPGIRCQLYKPVVGIRPEKALRLGEIIDRIENTPIIYVGEGHTNFEDHRVQLEIISGLFKRGRKIAIGMEMFQRPTQPSLDDYIAGVTSEMEFVRDSEYFARWKYNYNLYREILDFARDKKIPIIALNQDGEIIRKVAREGLDGLNADERTHVPADMDLSDEAYRRRLLDTFGQHGTTMLRSFDKFYQAQILWDETMAHTVDEFLKDKPGVQMIVLAGSGHIAYGSGIPKRVHRLNGRGYVTVLNSRAGTPITGLADYVLFPEPLEAPEAPVLGIVIKEQEGAVVIESFSHGSAALEAGMRKGDIIRSVGEVPVNSVEDVRLSLFDKSSGDTISVTITRKRFLLPDKALTFKVSLR